MHRKICFTLNFYFGSLIDEDKHVTICIYVTCFQLDMVFGTAGSNTVLFVVPRNPLFFKVYIPKNHRTR